MRNRLLLGLLALLFIVLGVLTSARSVGDQGRRSSYDGHAGGTVEKVTVLDDVYTRLLVSWPDQNGRTRHSQFDTDTTPWDVGDDFEVVFETKDPTKALPADEYYTNDGDLRTTAIVQGSSVAGLAVLLLLWMAWLRLRPLDRTFGCDPVATWGKELPHGAPAWDDPVAVAAWRRYTAASRLVLEGGVALAIVALIAYALIVRSDLKLLHQGIRVPGVVVAGGGEGGKFGQDSVRVRYRDPHGITRTGTLHGPTADDLAKGSPVVVIVSRSDPSTFRTPDYANHDELSYLLQWVPGAGAAGLVIYGVDASRKGRRGRHLMQRLPWRAAELPGERVLPYRFGTFLLLRTSDGRDLPVRFDRFRSPVRPVHWTRKQPCRVCASGESRWLLVQTEAMGSPYFVQLPKRARQRARWLDLADSKESL